MCPSVSFFSMDFVFPVQNMPTDIYFKLEPMLKNSAVFSWQKKFYFYFLFSSAFEISVSDLFMGNADSCRGASTNSVLQDGNVTSDQQFSG